MSLVSKRRRPVPDFRRRARSLLLCAGCVAGCDAGGESSPLARRVDALLEPLVAAHEFSGAVVLARHGETLYSRGFGLANQEAAVAFTADTPSDGASLAKTFTAAGVQWLAAEGRIDLEAPVTRYLPGYPHAETTVRHLLSHSNGLPPYYEFFDAHFGSDEIKTTEAMLRVVAREAPAPRFPPGSRFEYSNFGYDLAALILERVSGQRFEDFLRERFWARLGLHASYARPARLAQFPGVRTRGYRHRAGVWSPFDVFDLEGFLGASNLYFPAVDLERWASAFAAGRALPAEVFAAGQRRSPIAGQPSPITGLSWYCDESGQRCYYTGSLNAFHGFVYWDRARDEAAVFVANGSLSPWRTVTLERDLVDALAGSPPRRAGPDSFEILDGAPLSELAATWEAGELGRVTVTTEDGSVRVRAGSGLEFEAFPLEGGVHYVPGPDWWLGFAGGRRPAELRIRSVFVDVVARRLPRRVAPRRGAERRRRQRRAVSTPVGCEERA